MLTKTRKWLIAIVLLMSFVLVACTGDDKVDNTAIEISEADKALTITMGDTKTVAPTVTNNDKAVLTWKSDDPTIASVADGVITARYEGTATITVSVKGSKSEKATATIEVTVVRPAVEDIEISVDIFVGENGVLIGDLPMELSINATPATASTSVTWTSLDPSVATVDQDGKVTGLRGGKVKIRAVSTEDDSIKDEVEIMVYEDFEEIKVVLNAMQYVKDHIPAFVNTDLVLPVYENKLVKVEYFDVDGNKHTNGFYKYNYVVDAIDTINIKISYLNESVDFSVSINVVEDIENNGFTAIDAAKAEVEKFLKAYKEDKVRENVVFPTTYTIGEGEDALEVTVSWESSDSLKLTNDGVYTRPNDDSLVDLEAYFVSGNVTGVSRHKVVVNGYSQEEKIAYLKENVLPTVTEIEGSNINLPVRDSKFVTSIKWATNNAGVLTAAGKMDAYLETVTVVELTATITYVGTSEQYNFVQDIVFPITVKPAANDAQKVVLDFGTRLEADTTFPYYFPYGLKSREGNVLPLPTLVGGDGTFKDISVAWASGEEGLFNETWELQKQYLRYHEVKLTYTITVGENTATGEVAINVGITEVPNVLYIGGRFTATNNADKGQPYDSLDTISIDDGAAPDSAYEGWSGYTWYRDVTDEATGNVTRYQYFANSRYTYVAFEGEGGVAFDEEGKMTGNIKGMTGEVNPNYQYLIVVNNTTRDIQIPITYLNYKGSTLKLDINGTNLIRQCAVAYDGWRIGFAANNEGKVTFGFGDVNIETGLIEAAEKDAEGNYTLPETVTIGAGGFGWSAFTSNNNLALKVFAEADAELVFQNFTPKY